ncbi:MAG: Eco57I restriction-modification methylase domain-containing protein [Verrucomicrobia bacterium]|nr:Eco57I restriction-modification methylase domain-containing protein [Verrucomicrobiota bacterium]MBI3868110.1 Eco57I restriction-modification methylase domain-containing protein [Verrucomicrobiota bacterium]
MKAAAIENSRSRREELGQFLTATPVANFMASLFGPLPQTVRLLDAGAGAGSLTAAFVSRCCEKRDGVRAIEAILYEVDSEILDSLVATMRDSERLCSGAGIRFSFTIHQTDFIHEMSPRIAGDLFDALPPQFDAAIANPPYRKISTDSAVRRALRSIGVESTNLYTGFIALIQRLLVPGGQLVGITPRSFCNGPYFRPFREDFLSHMELRRLHLFESRKAAFRDDSVLQENIIFHAVKGRNQPRELTISSSSGEQGGNITETVFPFADIVHPNDAEKFIHIPSTASHATAKETMDGLNSSLASLGVTVSTGRVVDFRLKDALRKVPEHGTVPLLYPCHFNGGAVHWPKLEARKPNAILDSAQTRPWLVPSGVYLLTKRFTSKEERRRLVACLFDPDEVKAEWVGFENHLNYFHANGHGLERTLAVGLYAFLNSTVVDQYFRRFSGHTQVNATDLRTLAYPDRDTLQAMGRDMKTLDLSQDEIDQLVTKHLHARR